MFPNVSSHQRQHCLLQYKYKILGQKKSNLKIQTYDLQLFIVKGDGNPDDYYVLYERS